MALVEVLRTIFALGLLLLSARLGGLVFVKIKQPTVIGEILGGFLLGPTIFGVLLPQFRTEIFRSSEAFDLITKIIYQSGLVLLMFISGLETENIFAKGQRRTAMGLVFLGTFLPLAAGFAFAQSFDLQSFMGPTGTPISLAFVLGCAAAVTSLPVLSRIFIDLGILQTPFCRLILAAALMDDIILYVIMALVLAVSNLNSGNALSIITIFLSGLPAIYQTVIAAVFQFCFAYVFIRFGFKVMDGLVTHVFKRFNLQDSTGFFLIGLLLIILLGQIFSVPLMLSSFCAGVSLSKRFHAINQDKLFLKSFSISYLIPIYFAIIGSRINLIENFSFVFTLTFLVYATVVKTASIWWAAKLARYPSKTSLDIAMTMNARGGPGIILASIAYDAKIINLSLFTTLILLAILTCLFSAFWLRWRLKNHDLDTQLVDRRPLI